MRYEISGLKAVDEGFSIRTVAESAAGALRIACQWAEQGVQNITITNPGGESYDLDRFGMIASTGQANPPDARQSGRSATSVSG
jgi:hypothetical protein